MGLVFTGYGWFPGGVWFLAAEFVFVGWCRCLCAPWVVLFSEGHWGMREGCCWLDWFDGLVVVYYFDLSCLDFVYIALIWSFCFDLCLLLIS